jgi:two-component system NtrC family sensor kinase
MKSNLVDATTANGELEEAYQHLYKLERRRADALAAISAASREIATSPDLQGTLRLVMDKAAQTLPMDAGALFLLDAPSQRFEVAISYNLTPERVARITFAFDEGVPGWVVSHQEALLIDDAAQNALVHPAVVEDRVKSVLAVPLITRDHDREQVIGVLNLFSQTSTGAFDTEALQLAQVYADQTAVFIAKARLMDELRRSAVELEERVERRTSQLKEKQAQVIRAEKMVAVGRLAASVAHEVNNPLQAVTLHAQIVADEDLNDIARESIGLVQHELDRIATIVQRLLEFQRPRQGLLACHHVEPLLQDVLALTHKQFQQAGSHLSTHIAPDLSPILIIRHQIEQVFLNLVLNAIEAMPDGGELSIRAYQIAGTIHIDFADNGSGMSPTVLQQLFEPFFSTKHTGSGLGLAISHEIIEDLGGTLTAKSELGMGSTFTVQLPACQTAVS